MKKYLFFIILMSALSLNAQFTDYIWTYDAANPPIGELVNDWHKPVWQFVAKDTTKFYLSPFYESDSVLNQTELQPLKQYLNSIGILPSSNHNVSSLAYGTASDFKHSDGWRLLSLDLGDSTIEYDLENIENVKIGNPYVAFYNVERGIIRTFFREVFEYEEPSQAMIEFTTNSTNNTGILSTLATGNKYTSQYIVALDKRNKYSKNNGMFKYIEGYDGKWVFADFYVAYDNINQLPTNTLTFKLERITNSSVNMNTVNILNKEHAHARKNNENQFNGASFEHFSTPRIPIRSDLLLSQYGAKMSNLIHHRYVSTSTGAFQPHTNYFNKLNNRIAYINNNLSDLKLENYINIIGNIMYFYSGYLSGVNTLGLHRQPNIKGLINDKVLVNSFTIRQPGAPGNQGNAPLYNNTLGVVNYTTSPKIENRNWSENGDRNSYRISSIPEGLIVNLHSGLNPNPRNVEISFNFMLYPARNNSPYLKLSEILSDAHSHLNFIDYSEFYYDSDKYRKQFSAFTYFIDSEDAKGLAINLKRNNNMSISTMVITVKAIFDYLDPDKEPYLYLANYQADRIKAKGSTYYDLIPAQRVSNVYENFNEIALNRIWARKYVVDYGATLTFANCIFTAEKHTGVIFVTKPHFGFEVKNGTFVVNNSSITTGFTLATVKGPLSNAYINNSTFVVDDTKMIIEDGAKLYINNSDLSITETGSLLASGIGTEVHLNNLTNVSDLKNIYIEDGAKLYITGSAINISDNYIRISGTDSELIVNNNSEVHIKNSAYILAFDRAKITINNNSNIKLWNNSRLYLNNRVSVNVNDSNLLLNNSSLYLSDHSKVVFFNSAFKTYGYSFIVGNTAGMIESIAPETIDKEDNLNRGGTAFRWQYINKGDRLEFYSSVIRIGEHTEIKSVLGTKWDGLFIYNSYFNNYHGGEEANYNTIMGSVSDIHFIYLDNSFLNFLNAKVFNIVQVFAHKNSELQLDFSEYFNNTEGIHVADNSIINIWDSKIYNNSNGVLLEHSPSLQNDIRYTEIYNNTDVGLQVIQSRLLTTGNLIYDNLKGYVDFSSSFNRVRGGRIFNNTFVETAFRREYYPHFITNPETDKRPVIGDSSDSLSSYLMMALGVANNRINTFQAEVDTTDATRFYQTMSIFDFNDPMPDPVSIKFDLALERIESGDFQNAMLRMKDIISLYPNTEYARYAISYLPNLQISLNSDMEELLNFLNSIVHEDLELEVLESKVITNLFNSYFVEAIEIADYIIIKYADTIASLFAELDRIYAQWRLSQIRSPHSLSEDSSIVKLNDAEYLQNRDILFAKILNYNKTEDEGNHVVPPNITKFEAMNYPNPFNPETTIKLSLPDNRIVRIDIFNIRGQRVNTLLNENLNQGHHNIIWNGTDSQGREVSSGIYFYKIIAGTETITNRMLLMK